MSLEDIHMNTKDLLEKKRLDAGGFGTISLCFHKKHGYVVLKKVYTGPQRTEYNVSLLEEGRIMRRLQHDRVVKLLGVILEDGNYSLVMEYVDRGNMMKVLQNLSLPLSVRGRFVLEITEGMLYLHEQGFVHKDLKPENILVDRDFHIKIADLGVASFKSWSRLTQEETVRQKQMKSTYQNNAGTLFYMAPEHLCCVNTKPVEKSDVYSFGIVIWAIFANKEPYENAINENHICFGIINGNRPDIKEIADKCPVEIIDLMKQCWDEDSKKRPTFAEISERYEPFYYQNLGKNIEEDLKNLKKMWPESNELPQSMESLQIDAVPEDTSNGQIDQPNSLHSSQGPMTNEVNEALVAASPENQPIESCETSSAPPDNLERKLQHEYNYHAFGSRMDKETQPLKQIFSVEWSPGILQEKIVRVFSDPLAKPSSTSQQSELYPKAEKAASNTDPNFWPQPAATTPKWGNVDAFYRPNPNSLPTGNPVDAYGVSSASNCSVTKPPVPESGQNWQPQTNVNWYSKNADTDRDQPNSLHSSQGPMTNEVNEALVAASPEYRPVKIYWVPDNLVIPPDNLERKLQHEYNYHAFGSRMDEETPPSAQNCSVKLSPGIKEERKLKIYPYSFAKPSPTSQQSELYPRAEKAASNTNPYYQANTDPNFWPQPAATPKWGNADAFYRPNPNNLLTGNPVDAYGVSSASNFSPGYRDSTSFTKGTFAYHPNTSRVSSVPYTDDSIKYNISNSSAIQIGSYNHMKIEEQNPQASTSPVAMQAIYADYEARGVFDDTTVLTEKHLNLVREKLAKQWKHCARKLGFSDPEIDEIDHDYERDGLKEKVYQMLLKWVMREGSKGATVGKLAKALFGCQRLDLLRSLMQI